MGNKRVNEFISQQEVNDCLLVSVANFVHLITGVSADLVYRNILELIKKLMSPEDYVAWLDGHGMPLELISILTTHYGIGIQKKSFCGLPGSPCILVLPVDLTHKYDYHVILWTGNEIHDPIQFKKLKTTLEELTQKLEKVIIYA